MPKVLNGCDCPVRFQREGREYWIEREKPILSLDPAPGWVFRLVGLRPDATLTYRKTGAVRLSPNFVKSKGIEDVEHLVRIGASLVATRDPDYTVESVVEEYAYYYREMNMHVLPA